MRKYWLYIFPLLLIALSLFKLFLDRKEQNQREHILQQSLIELRQIDSLQKLLFSGYVVRSGFTNSTNFLYDKETIEPKLVRLLSIYKRVEKEDVATFGMNLSQNDFHNLLKEFAEVDSVLRNNFKSKVNDFVILNYTPKLFSSQIEHKYYCAALRIKRNELFIEAATILKNKYIYYPIHQHLVNNAIVQPTFSFRNDTTFVNYLFAIPFDTTKTFLSSNLSYHFDERGFLVVNSKVLWDTLRVYWKMKNELGRDTTINFMFEELNHYEKGY